jgi:hypothetical protein
MSPPRLFNSLPIYRRERAAPERVNIAAIGAKRSGYLRVLGR